jgi:hypothetical protein
MITYRAVNKTNGRFYIGSTKDLGRRKRDHRKSRANTLFQLDYRENPENFEWEVYEDESDGRELEEALLEMYAGTELCYNASKSIHGGGTVGGQWWRKLDGTEESLRTSCPGEGWVPGRLQSSVKPAADASTGRVVNSNTRKLLSEKLRGRKRTEDSKTKMKIAWEGKQWWVNPKGETCRAVEKPGEAWVPGRVYPGA